MEKQDLTQKLERTIQEIEELKVQLDENKTIADSYVRDLKAQCSKLSIQINGMNHNPEIFDKEIANLSVEDLKLKIDGLEKQLAQSIPIGKQTETKTMVVKERLNEGSNDNPELHKFK
jgi:chromosome segregation ATPase